ncbi:isopentenyl-diphosphate Delta-isomerase [Corynebacterium macginleyi]|uniref:isopentenyl-diphosphate Delta-isomerase n=1 Tax=Corynebacterium macginleyi TaxID=38290 RepID=UPI00190A47E5|nr:isopentenyl-diphosphate Delta-isomerase [Corynebacterium macginleyi]MBK4146328.1 isopentenyl-diphosphate Delta-isomerase [Corynebacterium macginleyi]MBM0262346.1 isopentenyl-diphosphate Delta-isomerase [Corynebacterium macginleyi]
MTERVVLAGADGTAIGTALKSEVHTTATALHFAFSAWVTCQGKVLITRRALGKQTWPGVWTNSFCGHPGPGESTTDAVIRRAEFELGIPANALSNLRVVLPNFSYRAVDSSGLVENEICPVYCVELDSQAQWQPHPDEVDTWEWVYPANLIAAADSLPAVFSPWMCEELAEPELRAALQSQAH